MYSSFVGQISDHVRALEQELDYYRNLAKEQREVIEQLHRGYSLPGRPTYIHPADLSEILNGLSMEQAVNVFCSVPLVEGSSVSLNDTIRIDKVTYKQSTSMPQITTKFR